MLRRLLAAADQGLAIRIFAVVLFAATAASAGEVATARWVDGLPPVSSAGDLGLTSPRFALVDPPPGGEARVYIVAGRKDGRPFSAAIVEKDGRAYVAQIPEDWVQFPLRFATLTILYPVVPPVKVTLGLQSRFAHEFTYQWKEPVQVGSILPTEPLPPLKAKLLDGEAWSEEELRGRVSVLVWWATSCSPCVDEIPSLDALVEEFGSEPRVAFVSISPESRKVVQRFLEKHRFAYRQLYAREGEEVFGGFPPRHLVLDPERKVVFDHLGPIGEVESQIREAIRTALAPARTDDPTASSEEDLER